MTPRHTRPLRRRLLAALILVAVLAAACGGDDDDTSVVAGDDGGSVTDEPTGEEPAEDPFGTGEWTLVSAVVDGSALTLLDTHPVTLSVDDAGGVGGTAACNGYFGAFTDGPLLFDGFGVTEMACDPPEAMDLEFAFLQALARTANAVGSDGELTLTGDGVELRFEAVAPTPDAELTGTTWMLDTIIDGDAASSIIAGTTPELLLAEELALFDGCNTIAGGYEIDGDALRTGSLRSTARACEEGVMRQASAIAEVLAAQPTISISGDRLTLTGAGGLALSFRAG
ncbi:MAG: META domain-containing protein [Actinomycetota bacterium]